MLVHSPAVVLLLLLVVLVLRHVSHASLCLLRVCVRLLLLVPLVLL